MFANSVLPEALHRRACRKIKEITLPEKHCIWMIHDIENGLLGLENDFHEYLVGYQRADIILMLTHPSRVNHIK